MNILKPNPSTPRHLVAVGLLAFSFQHYDNAALVRASCRQALPTSNDLTRQFERNQPEYNGCNFGGSSARKNVTGNEGIHHGTTDV
jgi:hypothetical protein